ncbi:hypothetical protein Esti_006492 [Eimeria stiedai]
MPSASTTIPTRCIHLLRNNSFWKRNLRSASAAAVTAGSERMHLKGIGLSRRIPSFSFSMLLLRDTERIAASQLQCACNKRLVSQFCSFPNPPKLVKTLNMENGADSAGGDTAWTFDILPERVDFAAEEVRILEEWRKSQTFKKSLELSKDRKPFSFYDGPPFATGLPHYGSKTHLPVWSDVVCRYAHQTGHYVERRFGWDCHGLPIEFEIDKQLGINSRQQVLDYGIQQYNEQCRSIVLRYSSQWETIVERTGRWIDFKNGYRTMDRSFMESVWWTFKQLFDKGKVYRAFKASL